MRLLLLTLALLVWLHAKAVEGSKTVIEPVPLQDVSLRYNSRYDKAVSLNRDYILELDDDRLLYNFRLNAGFDPPGKPLGGWEDPNIEESAGPRTIGSFTGDKAITDKANLIVKELRTVQKRLGSGYLSAFPTEHFVRLRKLQAVWAPFYVIHKIMAGLLDQYVFLGNKLALEMVIDEAGYFLTYLTDIVKTEGQDHWYQMLETEYGGMEEVLFNLYGITGDEQWQQMATNFTKPNFFYPLTQNKDDLAGRHANTHLAQVNGFAAGYATSGSKKRQAATSNFFDIVIGAHSYATGGNNDGEYWQQPYQLGASIAGEGAGRNTEETCTTYNMMKIARYLFQWTGHARYADYYERAILNGMLGVQRMPANYTSRDRETPVPRAQFIARQLRAHEATDSMLLRNSSNNKVSEASSLMAAPVLDWRQQAEAQVAHRDMLSEQGNSPGPGVIIYLMPLGAGNSKGDSWHKWSTPFDSFWCCSGSIVESFGKLMDSIYFQRVSESSPPELFINQLTPSTLHWRAANLKVTIETEPFSPDNLLRSIIAVEGLEDSLNGGKTAVLRLRVPNWVVPERSTVSLQHKSETLQAEHQIRPGGFVTLERKYKAGDKLTVEFGVRITTEKINDWHPEFNDLRAVIYGNYLMAAITDHDRDLKADPQHITDYVYEVSTEGLMSLSTRDGSLLCQTLGKLSLISEQDQHSLIDCTFRGLQPQSLEDERQSWEPVTAVKSNQPICFESMGQPGKYLNVIGEASLAMERAPDCEKSAWVLLRAGNTTMYQLLPRYVGHASKLVDEELNLSENGTHTPFQFFFREPAGRYPEGAKLLKGQDKSYIVAPIGHLVEEKYTAYLQFNPV